MKKGRVRVKDLAVEAKMDVDDATLTLYTMGIPIENPHDFIPPQFYNVAREALKLPEKAINKDLTEVAQIAEKVGLDEDKTKEMLYKANILSKRRLKRIPKPLLKKAYDLFKKEEELKLQADKIKQLILEKKQKKERIESKKEWPTIGKQQRIKHITVQEIHFIHWELVEYYKNKKDPIAPAGVKSQTMLESAAFRPHTSLGMICKYPSVAMAASSLLHAVILDHPFHNGNKRTAFVSMLALLEKNGWVFTLDPNEIYDFLLILADHKLTTEKGNIIKGTDEETLRIAKWVQQNIRLVQVREYPLQFRQLRSILHVYDCKLEFAPGTGNRVNIKRGKYKFQIGYQNEGADVSKDTIHDIRKALQLDEEHGYDSDIFYKSGPKIPEFINENRKLLNRLAKV